MNLANVPIWQTEASQTANAENFIAKVLIECVGTCVKHTTDAALNLG